MPTPTGRIATPPLTLRTDHRGCRIEAACPLCGEAVEVPVEWKVSLEITGTRFEQMQIHAGMTGTARHVCAVVSEGIIRNDRS